MATRFYGYFSTAISRLIFINTFAFVVLVFMLLLTIMSAKA
jgi:hypothetical protein